VFNLIQITAGVNGQLVTIQWVFLINLNWAFFHRLLGEDTSGKQKRNQGKRKAKDAEMGEQIKQSRQSELAPDELCK